MGRNRETDSVRATTQRTQRLKDHIRDRILQERQQRREQKVNLHYDQAELAEQAGVSVDTLKRFKRGDKIRISNAEKITRFLGLELADIIEPSSNQLPSDFYIERVPLESLCYETIVSQSGALIRVKAPHGMGKTWFVGHLLEQAQGKGFQLVTLSFRDVDSDSLTGPETFFKWFCNNIGDSLELPSQLEERWQQGLDKKQGLYINCTKYFEKYLLKNLTMPLVLILDDLDLVFEQSNVSDSFCKLLRNWYDKARRVGDSTWKNLRLVIVHSTDNYAALDINHSPLANVGTVFDLRKFSLKEVTELVQQYEFDWQADQIEQIMKLIGGNPYLIHKALDHLRLHPEMTLEQLLDIADTALGPYHNYLGELLNTLQQNSNLAAAFKSIVSVAIPIKVEPAYIFQLCSMGLVELEARGAIPSCNLYVQYFCDRL
jgi:DNA-binding Xre family transcriptional regulator